MGITKNIQTQETISKMAKKVFPQKEAVTVTELTEGMCNAAYLVQFSDGSKSVLKIASDNSDGFISNEVNLMDAEVKAMRLVKESKAVKVAEVQYYDTSQTICGGNYFFMEAIYMLISNVLVDAGKKDIVIGVAGEEILSQLKKCQAVFDTVKHPTLVRWDMWEGNIFVKDKRIVGVIEWERAMWGEAYMDDRFRRHTRNAAFLEGFGQMLFTENEMCRIYWYDVLLYLTMMTEGAYWEYKDDGQYRWVKTLFEDSWKELQDVILNKSINMQ